MYAICTCTSAGTGTMMVQSTYLVQREEEEEEEEEEGGQRYGIYEGHGRQIPISERLSIE